MKMFINLKSKVNENLFKSSAYSAKFATSSAKYPAYGAKFAASSAKYPRMALNLRYTRHAQSAYIYFNIYAQFGSDLRCAYCATPIYNTDYLFITLLC